MIYIAQTGRLQIVGRESEGKEEEDQYCPDGSNKVLNTYDPMNIFKSGNSQSK